MTFDINKLDSIDTKHLLVNPDFIGFFRNVLNDILVFDNTPRAMALVKLLPRAMITNKPDLSSSPELSSFYQEALIQLKFIALPLLDNQDIVDLVKNHFTKVFSFYDYNVLAKLDYKIINIIVTEDKDKLKAELKNAILSNREIILEKVKAKTVADWLRDYIANMGLGPLDHVKKAQYLVDLTKVKDMDEVGLNRLKVLFDFYETTRLSSMTPQGIEEEPPIVINGKIHIFRRGILEPVNQNIKLPSERVNLSEFSLAVDPKTGEPIYYEADKVKPNNQAMIKLQEIASQYPAGSLERKAVEEEIRKEEGRSKK